MPATEFVRHFRGLRALVIGDAMLDSYIEGSADRLCSEGPVPVVSTRAERRVPGGAANTAANLRALGAEVAFTGIVGRDHAGALLRSTLREAGVSNRWLVEDSSVTTLQKQRIIADGQYVVRVDDGETRLASALARHLLLESLEGAFDTADVVVVSDYTYGVCFDELIARLRELRQQRPIPLIVDSKQLQRFARSGATVVTPNNLEACSIVAGGPVSRLEPASIHDVERTGKRLLEMIDAAFVVVTIASDGVVLLGRDGSAAHLPANPVARPADVGAGDSFASALALALAAGADCVTAAQIGIDAAGIAVSKAHTSVVEHQELLQRISLRDLSDKGTGDGVTALASLLVSEKLAGKRIVFTNGVFDILHAGHVAFLREAKQLGDILVVGVNSDESARRLKGKRRPINAERDRLALIQALGPVDHAILFDESDPSALIRSLRPDVHAKGGDYADVTLPEEQVVFEIGGQVVILPLAGTQSTSAMIDRILALASADGIEAIHD
jgi:D-beta-D-heptose 7-phosphate kinase / D-beta-D-heptose 1-phosphate adenosyltransferase